MPDRVESTEAPPAVESTARRRRPRRTARGYVREAALEERPRDRLLRSGANALSDAELVAVLFHGGRDGDSAVARARALLEAAGGLAGLVGAHPAALQGCGIGTAQLAALVAAVEVACRIAQCHVPDREPLERPAAVARYLSLRYSVRDQEVVGALYLDSRNRLLGEKEIYRGTLNRVSVEPREILKEALLRGAAAVVIFHSHPTGDPSPSADDLLFTRHLAAAGELVGIRLADHLIIGAAGRWVSLHERGAC